MSGDVQWERSPFDSGEQRFLAGRLGVWLFLASLAMLFGGSVIGFIVIRLGAETWPDAMPALPAWLWLSTLLLVGASATIHAAVVGERTGRTALVRGATLATIALALAFLAVQTFAWWSWRADLRTQLADVEAQRFALSGFYVLTGVHAAHVIGGLIPLAMLVGRRTPPSIGRLRFCAMYWHFLDIVWILLFITLLIGV